MPGNLTRPGIGPEMTVSMADALFDWQIAIVITFYSAGCLGQKTAKGIFRSSSQATTCYLSTTHGGGFTRSIQC